MTNDHMTLSRLFNSLDLSSLNDKMRILLLEGLNELIYRHTSFYYTTLCFTVLHRHHFFFFLQIENLSTLCREVDWYHFSNSILSLHVSGSHFGNSCNISNFFIIIIFVMVICDQWSVMQLLQKDNNSLKAQVIAT